MKSRGPGTQSLSFILCTAVLLIFFPGTQDGFASDEIEVGIDLAQSIVNLQSSIEVITFHTNIKWYSVACGSVILTVDNDPPASVPVYYCTSDSRGYLKAHFLMQEIEDVEDSLIIGEENPFVLEGQTKDGIPFWGVQDLLVVDVKPRGR